MGNYYILTDTHFGHANMEKYCGRPRGFEEIIFKNLKDIKPDDILIHLGDICIGKDAYWHGRLAGIPCKKILVRGNHDHASDSWYYSHGWDFVCWTFSNELFGKKILFSHMPSKDNGYDINIHGHMHNHRDRLERGEFVSKEDEKRGKEALSNLNDKQILLALEEHNYAPWSLKTLIEKFK